MAPTHEVTNQVPPLGERDVADDPALLEGLTREGAGWFHDELRALGREAGSHEAAALADAAHTHEPRLRTHDRHGHRVDEVDYDPGYHELMRRALGHGLGGAPWADGRPGAHVARAAGFLVWGQVEAGHLCPVSMTYAAVPALRTTPSLAARLEPGLTARSYDPVLARPDAKGSLLAGMGMTEKQGGSDVRANTTVAVAEGDHFRLRGHKWFTSAPMCDVFLVLARTPAGVGCFLVPRVLDDGTRNPFALQRLKDKLGNRANASSEPEFDDTVGHLVGEEGRGVRTIIEMVACTRLDNTLGSAAAMRSALVTAVHHTRHRHAFGSALIDKPLMRAVLADLALESEAATTLALRLAGAQDRAGHDPAEAAFRRIGVALGKYWVCKRGVAVVAEALECLGGNGYVEESGMPRLYREAPLNSIWEGSGNVNALDLLRVLAREPASLEAYRAEVTGLDPRLDLAWSDVEALLADADESRARTLSERMAILLQAALLVRHAPAPVADAFCASRLAGQGGATFGTLPRGVGRAGVDAILARVPAP